MRCRITCRQSSHVRLRGEQDEANKDIQQSCRNSERAESPNDCVSRDAPRRILSLTRHVSPCVLSLVSHLTNTVSDVSIEQHAMCRRIDMKEGAAFGKTKELALLFEPDLLQRGLEQGAWRHLPQGRTWSQRAEKFEVMPTQQKDPYQ